MAVTADDETSDLIEEEDEGATDTRSEESTEAAAE